jgi:putative transposase
MDDRDRLRFVHELYEANSTRPVRNLWYALRTRGTYSDLGGHYERSRERLVDVHAWCLMGNHYHLLLSECVEGGLSKFLMKFNVGYTKYFNERHERSGVLFQGKTKRVLIETERQFLYILPYIHLNPLDFLKGAAAWRAQCPANPSAALAWVRNYRWSSLRNYEGETGFADILEGSDLFSNRKKHARELERFLRNAHDPDATTLNLE